MLKSAQHKPEKFRTYKASATKATKQNSEEQKPPHIRVGVGVLVRNPKQRNHIFDGIRKGSHGSGTLALPGGHLEFGETWEQCAEREILEETDLKIQNISFAHVTNDLMETEKKHYITIFMMCDCCDENAFPTNLEPHKCDEGWKSFSWGDLVRISKQDGKLALFSPLMHFVENKPERVLHCLNNLC